MNSWKDIPDGAYDLSSSEGAWLESAQFENTSEREIRRFTGLPRSYLEALSAVSRLVRLPVDVYQDVFVLVHAMTHHPTKILAAEATVYAQDRVGLPIRIIARALPSMHDQCEGYWQIQPNGDSTYRSASRVDEDISPTAFVVRNIRG